MKKDNKLDIIKYNKRLQKRLNLSINDYKEYSQLYILIEIELKIIDNKYGDFINISDEEMNYYHIYFDNSKEEINRNYLNENEKVNFINIELIIKLNHLKDYFIVVHT